MICVVESEVANPVVRQLSVLADACVFLRPLEAQLFGCAVRHGFHGQPLQNETDVFFGFDLLGSCLFWALGSGVMGMKTGSMGPKRQIYAASPAKSSSMAYLASLRGILCVEREGFGCMSSLETSHAAEG